MFSVKISSLNALTASSNPGFKRFGDDETSANRLVGGYFLGFFKAAPRR